MISTTAAATSNTATTTISFLFLFNQPIISEFFRVMSGPLKLIFWGFL